MGEWLAVAAGGALGALARWLLAGAVQSRAVAAAAPHAPLPWGTLAVNVLGALLVGALAGSGIGSARPAAWRLFLVTGFAGGFTTYSAFNHELIELLQAGAWPRAALYAGATLAAALAGGFAGVALARAFAR